VPPRHTLVNGQVRSWGRLDQDIDLSVDMHDLDMLKFEKSCSGSCISYYISSQFKADLCRILKNIYQVYDIMVFSVSC
jgi:hypothetical protein